MTSLLLPYQRDDSKSVIKLAFELMDSIDSYADQGQRIVGKQDASIMGGNGARITVDIPEVQSSEDTTEVSVDAEKKVSIDMATDEDALKSDFLETINVLREKEIEELPDPSDEQTNLDGSKQVASASQFGDDQTALGLRFIFSLLIALLFIIIFTAIIIP